MNGVYANNDEPIERLLRRFNRVVEKSGVLSEVKKLGYYEKPSEKKRRKEKTARYHNFKDKTTPDKK